MSRVAITLLAKTAEPTESEARLHAIGNGVSVILGLAWIIERHADPVARAQAAELVDASRQLKALVTRYVAPSEEARRRSQGCDLARR